jgi:hypothetical protein
MRFRNHKQGLLLSELGSYLDGSPGLSSRAAAGSKRISNLLRSLKWRILHIDRYLLEEADQEVKRLKEQGKTIRCIWDGSGIEKPESSKIEGLCPVVSSKAKRLHRSQKGLVFHVPPRKPVTVAGMQWTGALITGVEGMIKVAIMNWWTTKGDDATKLREQEEGLLIFLAATGQEKKLWQSGHAKKYLSQRLLRDGHLGEKMPCAIWWTPIRHPG